MKVGKIEQLTEERWWDNQIIADMLDLVSLEDVQKMIKWSDDRPLTDETLEELGFVDYHKHIDDRTFLMVDLEKELPYQISLVCKGQPLPMTWKAVGSVGLLISALKGDK